MRNPRKPKLIDSRLKSFPELPEGYEVNKMSMGYTGASKIMETENLKKLKDEPDEYHYCNGLMSWHTENGKGCGWVEGAPASVGVNTLAPLSGRRGTDYFCAKCGGHIGFFGCRS